MEQERLRSKLFRNSPFLSIFRRHANELRGALGFEACTCSTGVWKYSRRVLQVENAFAYFRTIHTELVLGYHWYDILLETSENEKNAKRK